MGCHFQLQMSADGLFRTFHGGQDGEKGALLPFDQESVISSVASS